MVSQSLLAKVVNTIGQIVVAWYLFEQDFGLATIAYTFSVVPSLIQQGGLKEVLIQRHQHFRRWASPAFWMSMTLGTAGGIVMAALAPLASHVYHEPRLFGLLLIIAALFPLDSLSMVPLARMQGQLRFRLVAALSLAQAVTQMVLTVVLAKIGWGPYSLVAPRLVITTMTAIVCWTMAPIAVRRHPQLRRWRFLVGDGALVIAANACDMLIVYGAPFILSVLYDKYVVGLYSFAFNLSIQTVVLITASLGGVLFPALSTLRHQPQRQGQAFVRALRLLACVAVPACWLQAAMADAGIHSLFPERWYASIQLVQILSLGMAFRAFGRPALSLLQAQGRFGTQLALAIASTVLFATLVLVGARIAGAIGVAIAVALHMLVVEPINIYIALRPTGRTWTDLVATLGAPMALAMVTIGPAALAGAMIPSSLPGVHWWRLLIVFAVATTLYVPLFKILAPDAWREAHARIAALRHRPPNPAPLDTSIPAS